jgi:hypothetical protein
MTKKQTADAAFAALFTAAHNAGMAAGTGTTPPTMVLTAHSNPLTYSPTGPTYVVPDGPCGFATVTIRPANCAAAKFAKLHLGWRTDSYSGGLVKSVPYFNQSMMRKEAYAQAFAAVLTASGLYAHADSRMD